jgi:riboflavin kinase/FMN adenylyltransferase
MTNSDRLAWLATSGVDHVLSVPFDVTVAGMEPNAFLDMVFKQALTPVGVHVGSNFHYGRRASGTVDDLRVWAAGHGCTVDAHELLGDGGVPVSATRIRDCLQAGRLDEATRLLTRPYYVHARVVPGRMEGRHLGFPTANIVLRDGLVRPADGVYGGYVYVGDEMYRAATSVGVPATFAAAAATIEAHLLDFEGDLYGREVELSFIEYLRPMKAFTNTTELQETVNKNITWVRENL